MFISGWAWGEKNVWLKYTVTEKKSQKSNNQLKHYDRFLYNVMFLKPTFVRIYFDVLLYVGCWAIDYLNPQFLLFTFLCI